MLQCCVTLEGHETVTQPPDSISSVARRKAVLQAATWPLRNAPAKVRRELVETWNELGKGLVLFPALDLIDAVCNHI